MSYTEPAPADAGAYKLAALQALATGGTAAKAALDQAKAGLEASRAEATKSAMTAAAQYGLGQRGVDELTAPVDRAYNRDIAGINTKVGSITAGLDSMGAPLSKVFDTKYAAMTQPRRGSGGGGGGGGGSGKKAKATSPWQDEYGTQANLTYALKKDDPGGKYGDYRQSYKTAVAKGLDDLTAQRIFQNSADAQATLDALGLYAQQGYTPGQVRVQLATAYPNGTGAATYYTQQYRQLVNQPAPAKKPVPVKKKK